jgi:predicted RNA-binding protein with PUA-like domain
MESSKRSIRMNYWIFKANPEHYRIDDRLRDPAAEIVWGVTRYHERITKGDTVFIWRGGTTRGVCAVMEIEECPYEPGEGERQDGYELPAASQAAIPAHWAKGRITQRFPLVEMSVIKKIPGLELFSFFSAFQQATNFSITRPEGQILQEFISTYKPESPVKKSVTRPGVEHQKAGTARTASARVSKPARAVNQNPEFALLKCDACGRYVVSSDTERHIREVHGGEPVEWKKTR